jgi:hypothetical protein
MVALGLGLYSPLAAQLGKEGAIAKAESILRNLREDKTAEIMKDFNPAMTQAISEEQLQAAWRGLLAQVGAFKGIDERRDGHIKAMQAVELMLSFEKEKIVQRTVFDSDGKVAGLAFQPASKALLPATR